MPAIAEIAMINVRRRHIFANEEWSLFLGDDELLMARSISNYELLARLCHVRKSTFDDRVVYNEGIFWGSVRDLRLLRALLCFGFGAMIGAASAAAAFAGEHEPKHAANIK